jgi:hypothetical protein
MTSETLSFGKIGKGMFKVIYNFEQSNKEKHSNSDRRYKKNAMLTMQLGSKLSTSLQQKLYF